MTYSRIGRNENKRYILLVFLFNTGMIITGKIYKRHFDGAVNAEKLITGLKHIRLKLAVNRFKHDIALLSHVHHGGNE